jgi:PPK2 family polyphosphate:nucleotide phosphotransferase
MPTDLVKALRIKPGAKPNLAKFDPEEAHGLHKGVEAAAELAADLEALEALQFRLYAENRRSLLIVLQGIDTAGKDGAVRHVFTAFNPQGTTVTSFKAPTAEEKAHDYLWRVHKACPAAGHVGIFNRSHYEDVLVVRVHGWAPKDVIQRRYEEINRFEQHLSDNGTRIINFFLYISKDEQKERFQARLEDPKKNWKFSTGDLEERKHWDQYLAAYEDALGKCSTKAAPWYLIPANKKWFRDLAIARITRATLEDMDPQFPPAPPGLDKIVVR